MIQYIHPDTPGTHPHAARRAHASGPRSQLAATQAATGRRVGRPIINAIIVIAARRTGGRDGMEGGRAAFDRWHGRGVYRAPCVRLDGRRPPALRARQTQDSGLKSQAAAALSWGRKRRPCVRVRGGVGGSGGRASRGRKLSRPLGRKAAGKAPPEDRDLRRSRDQPNNSPCSSEFRPEVLTGSAPPVLLDTTYHATS